MNEKIPDDLWGEQPEGDPLMDAPITKRQARGVIKGEFYLCPESWAHRAYDAVSSKGQFFLALRVFRLWMMRRKADSIVLSNISLKGPGFSRVNKSRMLQRLARAGLLEIVEQKVRSAPRLRLNEQVYVSEEEQYRI